MSGAVLSGDVQEVERARSGLVEAARETGVVWAGMFALGIGFGVLVVDTGFPWWFAPVVSVTLFAGSVEFILIGMFAAGAPIASVALTTLLINSRHAFYGFSFPLHRVQGRWRKAYSVFALCDEAYAIASSNDPATLSSGRILGMQLGMHGSWALGSGVGALVGAGLLAGVEGLDFVMLALFVVLSIDAFRSNPDGVALGLALAAGVVALVVAPGSMVLVAMLLFVLALAVRYVVGARFRASEEAA